MSRNKSTAAFIILFVAGLVAFVNSAAAINIWLHIFSGRKFDPFSGLPFSSDSRAQPVILGGVSVLLAGVSYLTGLRRPVLLVVLWSVLAATLVLIGLSLVRIQPDG